MKEKFFVILLAACLPALAGPKGNDSEQGFFDYTKLSEDELKELHAVSSKINEKLFAFRDANTPVRGENQSMDFSCKLPMPQTYYDEYEGAFVETKTIEVTLLKDFGGCPADFRYIEGRKINKTNDSIIGWIEHFEKPQGEFLSPYNDYELYLNCTEFLSLGHFVEKTYSTPRHETLYLSGQQWGPPATFNPLAESWMAAWPVSGRFNLMYEPLVTYNPLNGQTEGLLGHLVEKLSNNDSIVVDLNPAARWSDGKQVTSDDVKFIFTFGAVNTTEQIFAIHVDTLNRKNDGTVVERLSFMVAKDKRNNPLSVRDLLQAIRIVPAHVFGPLVAENGLDEAKKFMMDQEPVVSGPYTLKEHSPEWIVLERRDDYWGNAALHNGKLPAPKYIVHPIYRSNLYNESAFIAGNLDASMSFIPRIWYKKAFGVHTWFDEPPYAAPGSMPMLTINTTKEPLNDKRFRRALAAAIDYNAIRLHSVSNYASQLQPGLIIPSLIEKKYINEKDLKTYGVNLNIANETDRRNTVKRMLKEAGIKSVWKEDGTLDHMENTKGKRIPTLLVTSPAGWTDWESMVAIAVNSMRKAGIDVRENFVDGGQYWPAMGTGYFDLIMYKPAADVVPSLPWSRFNEVMSSRDWQPVGAWAGTNIGRYNQPGTKGYRPEVDKLLSAIPLMTNPTEIANAYRKLNKIFMEDQPAIPLVYMPEQFYEFSDRVWTNWPTAKNPYAPPQMPWLGPGTKILWELKPAE